MNGITVGKPVLIDLDGNQVKGRVCKVYPSNACCVQLENDLGCFRFSMDSLELAEEPAPDCSAECLDGC